MEARYPYQVWELEVPLAAGQFESASDVEGMVEAFHRVHERVFAVCEPGQYIECIYWKGRATAQLRKPELDAYGARRRRAAQPVTVRPAWFGAPVHSDTRCFRAEALHPGHRLIGPAIIQEPTTTVVVYPGWLASVTETGDYLTEPYEVQRERSETKAFDPVLLAVLANRFENDRARDDQHAAAFGAFGGIEHGARLLLFADHL